MNKFDYSKIPGYMRGALVDYVLYGTPAGGFLSAVIIGDLHKAVDRADDNNISVLPMYSCWLFNKAPAGVWGSTERYEAWINEGGMKGKYDLSPEECSGYEQKFMASFNPPGWDLVETSTS